MYYLSEMCMRCLHTTELFPKYNNIIAKCKKAYKKSMPSVTIKYLNKYYNIDFDADEVKINEKFPFYCCVLDPKNKKLWFIDRYDYEKFEHIINVRLDTYLIEQLGFHLIFFEY